MFDVLLKLLPGPAGQQYKADAEAINRLLIRGYITHADAVSARQLLGDRIEAELQNKRTAEEIYHVDQAS